MCYFLVGSGRALRTEIEARQHVTIYERYGQCLCPRVIDLVALYRVRSKLNQDQGGPEPLARRAGVSHGSVQGRLHTEQVRLSRRWAVAQAPRPAARSRTLRPVRRWMASTVLCEECEREDGRDTDGVDVEGEGGAIYGEAVGGFEDSHVCADVSFFLLYINRFYCIS